MSDRLSEIRARLAAFEPGKPFVTVTDVPLAGGVSSTVKWQATIEHAPADIAWLLDEVDRSRVWARAWRNHAWVQRAMWQDLQGIPRGQGTPPEVHRHLARREFRIIGRTWRRRAAERSMWYYLRGKRLGPRP